MGVDTNMGLAHAQGQAEEAEQLDESAERYAAFGLRIRQLFNVKMATVGRAALMNVRYTAYASDVGEAFRPIVPRWAVNATYGLAIAYITGDIGYTAYKEAQKPEPNVPRAAAHATLFQLSASLVLPAVMIHQTVHVAGTMFKRAGRFTKWGPTVTGLALIPFLPTLLDEPCEHAIDWAFEKYWPVEGQSSHAGKPPRPPSIAEIAVRGGASARDWVA